MKVRRTNGALSSFVVATALALAAPGAASPTAAGVRIDIVSPGEPPLAIELVDYLHHWDSVATCLTPCTARVAAPGRYLIRAREPSDSSEGWATVVQLDGPRRVSISRPRYETRRDIGLGFLSGGVVVTAVGAGLVVYGVPCGGGSDSYGPRAPRDCDALLIGIGVGVLGLAALVSGVILLATGPPLDVKVSRVDAPGARAAPAVPSGAVSFSGATLRVSF